MSLKITPDVLMLQSSVYCSMNLILMSLYAEHVVKIWHVDSEGCVEYSKSELTIGIEEQTLQCGDPPDC